MYEPKWKGPIEGYVVNFLTAQFWRVQATHERMDVMQEAFLVFDRCARKYPHMDTPQHFMALFKTSWQRRYHDLAMADSRERATFLSLTGKRDEDDRQLEVAEPVGETDCDGMLATMLRQAPAEVMTVLNLFLSAPQELLDLALDSWDADSNRKNSGNARLNRLLGFPPQHDAVGKVRAYFGSASC